MIRNLRWLHVSAVTMAAVVLVLIVSGAFITSGEEQSWNVSPQAHTVVAIVAGMALLALSIRLMLDAQDRTLRAAGWMATAVLALGSWGGVKYSAPLPPAPAIFHAMLAPVLLAILVAVAVRTSTGWQRGLRITDARGSPSLPMLASSAPILVLAQIGLGAAYRHKAASVLPHMFGALVVTILMMTICIVILQHFADHGSLRQAAVAGVTVVLVQIAAGITAFGMRMLDLDHSIVFVIATMAHVAGGALTLAASVVLALQVRRSVRR